MTRPTQKRTMNCPGPVDAYAVERGERRRFGTGAHRAVRVARGRVSRARMAIARNRNTKQSHLKFSSTAIQRTRDTMPSSHTTQASGLRGQSRVSRIHKRPVRNTNPRKPHTKLSATAHHSTRNTALATAAIQTGQLCRRSRFTLMRIHAGGHRPKAQPVKAHDRHAARGITRAMSAAGFSREHGCHLPRQ